MKHAIFISLDSLNYLFSIIILLVIFVSCSQKKIETYKPFSESNKTGQIEYSGTPNLWSEIFKSIDSHGKDLAMILDHGEQSLLLRINLIRSAKESISIQTFSWEFDEVGKFILWELIEANQKRGIEVHLLIDHMFNEHQLDLIAYLSTISPNFNIKYFNPSAKKLSPSFLDKISDLAVDFHDHNSRLHNKLFVVDNKYAITGGRNINNHYFDEVIGLNYKDRDVLIIQRESSDLEECISRYWNSEHSVPTIELNDIKNILIDNKDITYSKKDFIEYNIFRDIDTRANNLETVNNLFIENLKTVDSVEWIYDIPEKVEQAPLYNSIVAQKLLDLIESAKSEILIQSPYVVISEQTQNVFRALMSNSEDNLNVIVSTNSLAATDNWVTYAANYKEKRIYIEELGFKIWEFKPIPGDISSMMNYEKLISRKPFRGEIDSFGSKDFKINKTQIDFLNKKTFSSLQNVHLKTAPYLSLHAKSLVVDETVSFIGSYNLDPRSEIYNTELGVVIRDKNFSEELRDSIKKDILPKNSYLIAMKKHRPLISTINKLFYRVSEAFPFVDLWPIRPHASFELKIDKKNVNEKHVDFYNNWTDVGNFPGIPFFAKKQVSARIFKATGMIFKPLL